MRAAAVAGRASVGQYRKRTDHLTILTTSPGKIATKRFVMKGQAVEMVGYDAGLLFGVLEPYPVTSIIELSDVLSALEGLPNFLIIRGEPKDPSCVGAWVRRTGSAGVGNFETPSRGRRWIQIDFDKIEVPDHLSVITDPVVVCEYLVKMLPLEFHKASYHWTLSSSAGMVDRGQVSMHIWFWLQNPVADPVLKAWAKHVNQDAGGKKIVDSALFQSVQAHYTAAPIFDGVIDPIPVRSGLQKKASGAVDLKFDPPKAAPAHNSSERAGASSPSIAYDSGFAHHISMIGDHPGGEGFHNAIVAAAASYVGSHGAAQTDREELFDLLGEAVLAADRSGHDDAYVEQMASREHIMPAIDSALKKFGSQATTRKKSKIHRGVRPHYTSKAISVEEAQRRLAEMAMIK
jgi:hypothetical protein